MSEQTGWDFARRGAPCLAEVNGVEKIFGERRLLGYSFASERNDMFRNCDCLNMNSSWEGRIKREREKQGRHRRGRREKSQEWGVKKGER